ncbi:MAG: tetratricopeptide repeat-containing sensor histidine kinase, partial [Aurantibacter sp.]
VIYSLMGDYEESLKAYYKTLAIYESLKMDGGVAFTLNSIGIVNKNLKNYQQAIDNYKRAIEIHKKLDDKADLANAYSNLGEVYWQQDSLATAEEYFVKAREIDIQTNDYWGLSINNQKIGRILYSKGNYEEAQTFLEQAYEIQQKNDFKTQIAITLSALGLVNLKLGNFDSCEALLKKGLTYVPASKGVMRDLHHNLYTLYKETNKGKMALGQYEKYTLYKDSLIDENSLKNLNELQIQYETEKKDKELAEQQLEIQEQQTELQKKKTQYSIMTGITIFLLVSSLLGWFLYQQRQKRKNQEILTLKREQQVKTLESLMEGEEKERFRIAKELHDGVNGDLSAIKYKLSSMLEHNTTVVNEVVAMIDKSSEQVRAISHNLVPPSLEKFNLVEALEDYCATMNAVHEPQVTFQHIGEEIRISKNNEINIYRIVQELVSNSVKHAEATEITVQISSRENHIQITVEDNGKGFDANEIDSKGIGLKNLDSRIDYLNATKDLVSNSKGTSYTLEIDINKLNDN